VAPLLEVATSLSEQFELVVERLFDRDLIQGFEEPAAWARKWKNLGANWEDEARVVRKAQEKELELVRQAKEEAAQVDSLASLAAFRHNLSWLADQRHLPPSVYSHLLRMRDVSLEVARALNSDSATNRTTRLSVAANVLQSLQNRPTEFDDALRTWSPVIDDGLEYARQQRYISEPIPQVYIDDGTPVTSDEPSEVALQFKGREDLFRTLGDALEGQGRKRSILLLYGPRRTGKTSMLLQLPKRLGNSVIPVFLDMQSPKLGGAKGPAGLLGGIANQAIEDAFRYRGVALPAIEYKGLIRDPYPSFAEWLDHAERTLGAEDRLLLCIDEFEALEEAMKQGRLDTRILSTIRNTVQHRPMIKVLLSGSHHIKELSASWVSILVSTTHLRISFLEEVAARLLIEQPARDFPMIYAEPAVDRILALSHCQPYLIQLMCALLVERMNSMRRMPPNSYVTEQDVEQIIPLTLQRGQSYFIDIWRSQAGGEIGQRVLSTLASDPDGQIARDDLEVQGPDKNSVERALKALELHDIVERDGKVLRITVPMVAEYVRRETLM
jgi:hypothetical protein